MLDTGGYTRTMRRVLDTMRGSNRDNSRISMAVDEQHAAFTVSLIRLDGYLQPMENRRAEKSKFDKSNPNPTFGTKRRSARGDSGTDNPVCAKPAESAFLEFVHLVDLCWTV